MLIQANHGLVVAGRIHRPGFSRLWKKPISLGCIGEVGSRFSITASVSSGRVPRSFLPQKKGLDSMVQSAAIFSRSGRP